MVTVNKIDRSISHTLEYAERKYTQLYNSTDTTHTKCERKDTSASLDTKVEFCYPLHI